MKNNPLVSIICLCYNHESHVEESLDSLLNQSYKNIEIIIIDDKSTDNSSKIIKEWVKRNNIGEFISNPVNLGNTKSFNKGFNLSKGAYIVDFATDDMLCPDFIEKHLQNFETTEIFNPGVSYCNVALVDEDGKFIKNHFDIDKNGNTLYKPKEGDIYKELLHSYYLNPIGIFIKREVLTKLSGYDENLTYEDVDFWIRSSRLYNYIYQDNVLAKKRVLKTSLSTYFKRGGKLQKRMASSTYKICHKAYRLNISNVEDKALWVRCTYELKLALKNGDFILSLKYISLFFKITSRRVFKYY
ncbi:glycosyltransferase family 2 protein [Aquimarina sp. M1]